MKLIIATKNKSKFKSIKTLILSLINNRKINIVQISSSIPSANENGNCSEENCLIKINHYKKYLNDPFIVCDDQIDIIGSKNKLNFAHRFHELGSNVNKSPIEILEFIQDILLNEKEMKMIRTRYFGLVKDSDYKIFTDKFTGQLRPLNKTNFEKVFHNSILDNPLNHFIVPNKQKRAILVYNTQKKISDFIKNL